MSFMNKTKILFIHHSTGRLLLLFGKVRKLLKEKASNIELWDHSYNLDSVKLLSYLFGFLTFKTGLSDEEGKMTGKDFNIVISNNSPKEYAEIFSRDKDDFRLKNILSFDVVVFKNCFPTTKIETKEKLEKYKRYYSKIFESVPKFNNKFVVFTPPPLRKEKTYPDWAENARSLSEFIEVESKKYSNIFCFDFFDLLADKDGENKNMLKRDYCNFLSIDSHPNIRANKEVGRIFVDFLSKFN